MEAFFYIDSKSVKLPVNWKELSVQLMYDRDNTSLSNQPEKTVSITSWRWGLGSQTEPNDPANIINKWLTDGFVTEGIPFKIDLEDEGVVETLFDGYLDPQTANYDCDEVIIEAVEKQQIDWLNDVADSATYEKMFDDKEFGRDKFVSMPYIISTIPNSFEAMISIISMFTLMFVFTSQLQEIIEIIVEAINPLEFTAIVRLILRGIYVATMFVTLIIIIKQIINLLVQPVKYHDCMYTRDLLEIGASHFGYTFKSSIYDSSSVYYDEVILPEKFNHNINTNKDDVLGWLTPNHPDTTGYYIGTFGDLLRTLKIKYNAKIYFIGNELRFERRDFKIGSAQYKIDLYPEDGTNFRLNANELVSNKAVEFVTDTNDKNTMQRYKGTFTQIITEAITVKNDEFRLLKGFEKRTIPFARANRKKDLTTIEKIIKGFAVVIDPLANMIVSIFNTIMNTIQTLIDVIDKVLSVLKVLGIDLTLQGIINKFQNIIAGIKIPKSIVAVISGNPVTVFVILNIDLENLPKLKWDDIGEAIEDRRGMLLMENDFVVVPKMFIINESSTPRSTDIKTSDETVQHSGYIYDKFHFIDSFIPTTALPNGNQYKIYDIDKTKFCFNDFLNVKNSNFIKDFNNKDAELISLDYFVFLEEAKIEYKVNELYTNNLEETIITRTGT